MKKLVSYHDAYLIAIEHVDHADWLQVEYFKKQRVVNYQREQTIKKIESQGGEITAPQLPLPGSK